MELENQVAPEDLARSLIREFFLKQGYKSSLEAFEKEDNRPRVKMTKIDLIKLLSMERLIKNNKMKAQPQNTMLEILTEYLFSKFKSRQTGFGQNGDLTNTNGDDAQSVYSQNIRNQEFPAESVYGSQTNIQNKILGIPPSNHHRPLSDNNYTKNSTTGNSSISNGSGNIGVNSYLNSKLSGGVTTSGLNSQVSSSSSQPHTSNSSWLTQNSSVHPPTANSVEQQKPPKSFGISATNQLTNQGFQSSNNSKLPNPSIKNPLQEKGSDYLSILEEQTRKNSSSGSNNNISIGTPQYTGNSNQNNSQNYSASPFTDQNAIKNLNSFGNNTNNNNNNNDDGEFKFESRRGNMKKVARPPSNDKRGQQNSSEQVTSIRASFNNGLVDTNVTSTATTSKNQNSEFFANFNEYNNQSGPQSKHLDFNDPIFGEVSNESRLLSKLPNSSNNENSDQQQRPVSRQNKQAVTTNYQEESTASVVTTNPFKEKENEAKQFNFFNKKKKTEETVEAQQPAQNIVKNQDHLNDVDDFDQMLGGNNQSTSMSHQFDNRKKKKGVFEDDDEDLDFSNNAKSKKRESTRQQESKGSAGSASNLSDTEHAKINFFEPGITNSDFQYPKINFTKTAGIQTFSKKNIQNLNGNEIQEFKKLLFNQSQNKFLPTSWSQGFILNENEDTFYGLFQKEGGPCGVIACVQAFYLKYLFYVYPRSSPSAGRDLQDYKNKILRENCLVAALAEILFNARGEDSTIRFATIQNTSAANTASQSVPIECCGYVSAKVQSIEQAYEALHSYKTDYIGQHNQGITTFLYSVILTKGIKNILSEMDSSDNALIGHHGHCSQEQVNLFLTGKARSNCFDGEKVLDGELKLKGIDSRSQFGFLTIFEHLKYIEVGSYLKTPFYPVWIICKEYHYSVIFAKDYRANEKAQQPHFDLVYYDELYNPEDKIILTVTQKKYAKSNYVSSTTSDQHHFLFNKKNDDDEDMVPVIELVMRTKWGKEISVDWNGTQPIL